MKRGYLVECTGEVREVYHVSADSPEDAMERYREGECILVETVWSEPISVDPDDL